MTILPHHPDRADLTKQAGDGVQDVVDGEVVDLPPTSRLRASVTRPVIRAVATIREAKPLSRVARSKAATRTGQALMAAPRVTARVTYVASQGGMSWSRRAWDGATHGTYRRHIRRAEATGDLELADLWTTKYEKAMQARMARVLILPKQVLAVLVVAVIAVAVGLILALFAGVVFALYPGGMGWSDWWALLGDTFDVIGEIIKATVVVAVLGAVPFAAALAWREGKRVAQPPRWLVTAAEKAERDSVIDERMISLALAHLGIAALNAFFKEGGHLIYSVTPRVDGDGTYTQVRLPLGVTAEEIAAPRPRAKLAANLTRASLECWPTKGDEDGILDLWVADKGRLTAGAGPWPLQQDGAVDVFEGVPFGRSQRGDVVVARLFETNWLIGGRPGQGKSAAMRTLLLGAALDPTAELQVFVMGESPDFKPFEPRLSRYAMGMDDQVAEQAIQALRDALIEMERRGKVLSQQPGTPPKTSRKLADKAALGLHLLIIAIDECHELFQHPDYGREAEALAVRLIKRGRKYGIVLVLATQSPTKDSIPREVTRNVGAGVAFSVADHIANDGLLGGGKYKAGIRATELRMGVDRGTCMTVGITNNAFELVKTFYVALEDGIDEVSPVVARAMDGIGQLRRTGEPLAELVEAPVDYLAKIRQALRGEARVRTAVVLGRLIEADAATFEPWGFQDLAAQVPVRKSDGQSVIRSEDVERAISDRDDGLK